MPEHAIAIARVSTLKQHEEDQRPGLIKYAGRKDYELDAVVPVAGRSAFHGKHVKAILAAVKKHVAEGPATVVIFRHVDRSSREGIYKGVDLLNKIMGAGARIEFSDQEFLNDNPGLIGLFMEMAKEESEIKKDRALQGNDIRRAAGQLIGKVPWGYDPVYGESVRSGKKVQVSIKPNALGRTWIPIIFDAAINGKPLRAITDMLEGIPSPNKHKIWNDDTIRRIIGNTTYYGSMTNNPFMVFESLITVDVYKEANTALTNRHKRGRTTVAHEPALARPYCGACWGVERDGCPSGKSPMYRYFRRGKYYYNCRGLGPNRAQCGGPGIPADKLNAIIEAEMSGDVRPYTVRVPIAGDDKDEQRQVINEKISAAQATGDFMLIAKLAEDALTIGPSTARTQIVEKDTGVTVGKYWEGLSPVEKRDELLNWSIIAGMNNGEPYAIIDRPGPMGLRSLEVHGDLPGLSLLDRAKVSGVDKIVDAEAADDDWKE